MEKRVEVENTPAVLVVEATVNKVVFVDDASAARESSA